jgi:hypothetical protein
MRKPQFLKLNNTVHFEEWVSGDTIQPRIAATILLLKAGGTT